MFKLPSQLTRAYSRAPLPLKEVAASAYALWSSRAKYGNYFDKWYSFLQQTQWWSDDDLRAFQRAELTALLERAWAESPFYRDRMAAAGLTPAELAEPDALRALPELTKHTVRENYGAIKTSAATNGRLTFSTSGTTGTSLHVPWTAEALQREYAFRWLFQSVGGAKRGDRFAVFTGHQILPVERRRPPFHVRNFAEGSVMFSVYHMSAATIDAYADAFNAFEPEYVSGYPSAIYLLAWLAELRGRRLFSPRTVFTASEVLHEYQRETIERALGAPVRQWYGQVECTANLHECEEGRLHVKEEYGLLELLDADGAEVAPGTAGRVVATGFGNHAFPLIRYETSDNMVLSRERRCPCGRGGRLIEQILGRDEDVVVTPDGRHVGRLDFVLKTVDTVAEAQIVQESLDRIVIKVVPTPRFSSEDSSTLCATLREYVGGDLTVGVEQVAAIERGANGKVRHVVSKVGPTSSTDARARAAAQATASGSTGRS